MIKHTLLLIFRNFRRFKSTFIINLIGLSTGLACALLIVLWVYDEKQVDGFHANDDRLYQVMEHHIDAGEIRTIESTSGLLGESLLEDFPEIKLASTVSPVHWFDNFTLATEEKKTKANGQFVGNQFFNIFSYELIAGNPDEVMNHPDAIVLSEGLASSIFGSPEAALGKSFEWQLLHFSRSVMVTGIFKNLPVNSSIQFDFVLPFEKFKEINPSVIEWGNTGPHTYLLLKEGVDPSAFNEKIKDYLIQKDESITYRKLFIRPYADGYLYGTYENGQQAGGRIEYIRLFSLVAGFILVIACINFMNLTTAKASRRIKEVGIKKAVGAHRSLLIFQYMTESILMTFISLIIALAVVSIVLPQFNLITGKQLTLDLTWPVIVSFLSITLLTGIFAGSYPALYLSRFNPAVVLKGKFKNSLGELWARKGLVVFQFVMSAILIVTVLVVYNQIQFIQSQNLGFDKSRIITFPYEGKITKNPELFLSQLKELPGIENASYLQTFVENQSSTIGLTWEGKDPDTNITFQNFSAGYDMIATLGMEMVAGRSFSRDYASDSTGIILNETAVRVIGLENPIGAKVNLWGLDRTVIGVVKDFHYMSLHEEVMPIFIKPLDGITMNVIVKLTDHTDESTLTGLADFYQNFNPGYTFEYTFMDSEYQQLYNAERQVATLSKYFASLAIVISCLGLFGLAAFTTERRMKEIGIRKILGSSNRAIIVLLTTEFTLMVISAILIATPISYFLARNWLDRYTLRIDLEWWFFGLAGMAALIIALVTVGFQTLKASRINPVDCLQDD